MTCLSFLDYWKQSGCELVSSHTEQLPFNFKDTNINNASEQPTMILRLSQIRALQQLDGDQSCGYYCIFFVSQFSKFIEHMTHIHSPTTTNSTAETLLKQEMKNFQSRESFEIFKKSIIEELLIECHKQNAKTPNKKPCYPWSVSEIEGGILERVYLQFLQNNIPSKRNPEKPSINKNINTNISSEKYPIRYSSSNAIAAKYGFRYLWDCINLMEFNVSSLKTNHLPLHTISFLETFFKLFSEKQENYKTFIIGGGIHYVTLMLYRYRNTTTNEIIIDLLYADSQNNNILGKNKEYIMNEIISQMQFTSWLNAGWRRVDMEVLAYDSIIGIQFVVQLIINAMTSVMSTKIEEEKENMNSLERYFIRDKLISVNILDGFLGNFEEQVLSKCMKYIYENTNHAKVENIAVDDENVDENECKNIAVDNGWLFGIHGWPSTNPLNQKLFASDCHLALKFCELQLNLCLITAETTTDDERKSAITHLKKCAMFIKQWISSYYPSPVIDANVVAMLNNIGSKSYVSQNVISLLHDWCSLVIFFTNDSIRKLFEYSDNGFWSRLASTLLVVDIVCKKLTKINQTQCAYERVSFLVDKFEG